MSDTKYAALIEALNTTLLYVEETDSLLWMTLDALQCNGISVKQAEQRTEEFFKNQFMRITDSLVPVLNERIKTGHTTGTYVATLLNMITEPLDTAEEIVLGTADDDGDLHTLLNSRERWEALTHIACWSLAIVAELLRTAQQELKKLDKEDKGNEQQTSEA